MLVGIVIVVIYIIGMNIYIVSGFRSGLIRNSNLLLKGVVETNIFTGLGSIRRLSMSKWDDNLEKRVDMDKIEVFPKVRFDKVKSLLRNARYNQLIVQ